MEGFLYLCLVQDGVGGALHGRGVLAAQARTDVAMALGFCRGAERVGRLLYHLGEIVPGAYAKVGIVVDAALGIAVSGERGVVVLEYGADCLGKVQSVCRCAALVVDDVKHGAFGGEL